MEAVFTKSMLLGIDARGYVNGMGVLSDDGGGNTVQPRGPQAQCRPQGLRWQGKLRHRGQSGEYKPAARPLLLNPLQQLRQLPAPMAGAAESGYIIHANGQQHKIRPGDRFDRCQPFQNVIDIETGFTFDPPVDSAVFLPGKGGGEPYRQRLRSMADTHPVDDRVTDGQQVQGCTFAN